MAVVCLRSGSPDSYQHEFLAWAVEVRPSFCPHCGAEHASIFWGSYRRWVYRTTDRLRIHIVRVRCTACCVTDALLPSFLHMFRRYALPLIQQAILLAIDAGLWGEALANLVGPYHQPAPATIREWVCSFALSADWLLPWIQHTLLLLDPLTLLDLGRPPAHLPAIRQHQRKVAFTRAWQILRVAESLYAFARRRQADLAFRADTLLAFVAAALGAAGRIPRLLWPQATARAPA